MKEPKPLNGFWWLPDAPQHKWFGTLTQDGRRIELCCFAEQGVPDFKSMPQTFTVHGTDEKGRSITLLFADYAAIKESGSMKTIRFCTIYALIGVHLGNKDDLRVSQILLEVNYLYEWLQMTGFKQSLGGRIGKDCFEVTIPYVRPDQFEAPLQDGSVMGFQLQVNSSSSSQERKISENALVTINTEADFSFEQIWKATTQFRLLLHFAVLKPVYAEAMWLRYHTDAESSSTSEIEVWSPNLHSEKPTPLSGRQRTFRFQEIAPHFSDFYNRWLDFTGKYDEALGCYTTTVFHKLPSTVALLCLTQALDAFHGIHHSSHKDQDLRKKVRDIICSNRAFILGLIEDDHDFSDRVHATRNYHTHHNPKWLKDGKVAKGRDLIRMNEILKLLFQSCVLQHLGLPPEAGSALKQQIATDIIEY